jgi:hypothetical protein
MRGTSGSVQRRPANPARPGREQRYRDHAVCRRVPEVPLIVFLFRKNNRVASGVESPDILQRASGLNPRLAKRGKLYCSQAYGT